MAVFPCCLFLYLPSSLELYNLASTEEASSSHCCSRCNSAVYHASERFSRYTESHVVVLTDTDIIFNG